MRVRLVNETNHATMPASRPPDISDPPLERPSLTPAMRQYAEHKAQVPDAILFFRMGDFYEMFHEDARTAASVLGLTLTTRSKGSKNPVPLAGIPYHQLDNYLARFVRAGYKVAIAEQVEDPRQAKGVVKREIVRIVTPGTLTEDSLLDERRDNYLAAIRAEGREIGLAWVNLASGMITTLCCAPDGAVDQLARLRPAELLGADAGIDRGNDLADTCAKACECRLTRRSPHVFDPYQAEANLHRHFGVSTLAGLGYETMDSSLCAAAAILDYLAETQKTTIEHITRMGRCEVGDHLAIDRSTWRALEIEQSLRGGGREGTLLDAVDETATAAGARCLLRWLRMPLRTAETVRARHQAVAELSEDERQLAALRASLKSMADIERITARLGVGRASPRDLVGLGRSIELLAALRKTLGEPGASLLVHLRDAMSGLDELGAFLQSSLVPAPPLSLNEGGIIAAGHDEELDRLRGIGKDGQQWLADYQAREIERSGIGSLKVGFNRVFGYYIEITNAHRDRAPAEYVRKQTLKNAERYITDELKKYEIEALSAEERANDREAELFDGIRRRTTEHIAELQRTAAASSAVDVLCGFAQLAVRRRYVRPEIVDESVLIIDDGRHPVLDTTLADRFVPNDCRLTETDHRLLILTGPNMAGKSTYIRQTALLVLLAQTGSFVPARAMRWGLVDRLFARVGASDDIARGQSTFMVEMTETANILHHATEESLVILDEVGRGTSTYDGLALAWAVTEHLATQTGCRTLFATHYHELTELADLLDGVRNYNVAVRETRDEVVFLHRIVEGATDKSYGVHVARLAGIPRPVVDRAREILGELETNFARESHGKQLAARRTARDDQLLLFEDPANAILDALAELDLNSITPLEALEKLRDLQDRANG